MTTGQGASAGGETVPVGSVTVHFWASARAAAGTDAEQVPVDGPVALSDLVARLVAGHRSDRLAAVLDSCAVLVGEQPVGRRDRAEVVVRPGATVEFLPPFAGG